MFVNFESWTNGRRVASLGTNAGAPVLPFQKWRHFKEAFAPEIVEQAIMSSPFPVTSCLDPFGGSGTTALACQFLGVRPVTMEVNPYLADLIEAKLTSYDVPSLITTLGNLLRSIDTFEAATDRPMASLPPTFVEPGVADRWIFDAPVARRLLAFRLAIESLPAFAARRLFTALLGGIMIGVSNAVVNGKGRRYRRGWDARRRDGADVDTAFAEAATAAITEIDKFARRREPGYEIVRGDCRSALGSREPCDIAIFSPPYPNSFDYTDVYNIELWMLGYLADAGDNRRLRQSTVSSHVQVDRAFAAAPAGSALLDTTMAALEAVRPKLWNRRIPEMVGSYFDDMAGVIGEIGAALAPQGTIWMVVGDSRYADIPVPVAEILAELAPTLDLEVDRIDVLRDMRASAQQGGQRQLAESLVVLRRQ